MKKSTFEATLPMSALKPLGSKFVDAKIAALGGPSVIGMSSEPKTFADGVSTVQEFGGAAVFYHPAYGAVSVTPAIYAKWCSHAVSGGVSLSGRSLLDYLGFPTGDSFPTVEQGGSAAYFERGMIIVRANQQAYVISGFIYEHYRRLGDVSDAATAPVIGLPISDELALEDGARVAHFDGGDIYWSGLTDAREIHGAIRARWLALGGPQSPLGLPTSDECAVTGGDGTGRFNRFVNGFIYWSPASGAWDISGPIYKEWMSKGGPTGPLGYPVSGQTNTPALPSLPFLEGSPQGQFNDFQGGIIVWFPDGDFQGATTLQGLQLYVERYDCNEDFNVQIDIAATPSDPPNVNQGRMPSGGEYDAGGAELGNVLLTVPVVQGNTQITIWMLCIHEKLIGSDDEEGTVTAAYNIYNLWGQYEDQHTHQDGAFTATFELQPFPLPPVSLDPAQFRSQLFWPFHNVDVNPLTWQNYADTYSDVAATDKHVDLNPLSFRMHLFEITFYELVYRSLAQVGACFGFCLESVYARDHRSLFIEPVYTENSYHKQGYLTDINGSDLGYVPEQTPSAQDAEVLNEACIKHGYQLGASLVAWFLAAWVDGDLHEPIDAFYSSQKSFNASDWPIISVSSSSDLSQSGHVLVPYQWSPPQGGDLKIWVANINDPANDATYPGNDDLPNYVLIGSDNTYTFVMDPPDPTKPDPSGDVGGVWFGSPTTGGRFLPIPYTKLNSQPVTPGDAIFGLITGGAVIILGGNANSSQITDQDGHTFYETGAVVRPAVNRNVMTRIPNMASIPLHDSQRLSEISQRARTNLNESTLNHIQPFRESLPEVYYLQRNQIANMQTSTPRASAPARTVMRDTFATIAMPLNERLVAESSLTFALNPRSAGTYDWAILAPRMSASISAPCLPECADTIHVDSVNSGDQAVTLNLAANSPAKSVNMAVGGFSGGDPADRRWYELLDLNLAAGHTLTAQVNNRGAELLLQNSGPATTFELRVHYGMNPAQVAVRSGVALEANRAFHIAPQDWSAETISDTPVHMTVFDAQSGAVVKQLKL